jgi:hypothetical protein
LGIKIINIWQPETRYGKTIVGTEESEKGTYPHIFRDQKQRLLEKQIDAGLRYLRARAASAISAAAPFGSNPTSSSAYARAASTTPLWRI